MDSSPARQSLLRPLLKRPEVQELARCAAELGSPAHLAGGALRDALLCKKVHDLDAVVAGRGTEIAEKLAARLGARRVRLGGDRFAADRLVGRRFVLDLWDRGENSLHEDLARRDLRVNALALALHPPQAGQLIDPFDGQGDLRKRRLRAVTPESFSGDPLRVLRLPRFALQLDGFGPDRETLDLARTAAHDLPRVSSERVREELGKIFALPGTERALTLLHQLGLYPALWLRREELRSVEGDRDLLRQAIPPLERIPNAVSMVGQQGLTLSKEESLPAVRLALTFRALAATTEPTKALEAFRQAGFLSRATTHQIAPLLQTFDFPKDEQGFRTLLHQAGTLWRPALLLLTAQALSDPTLQGWTETALPKLIPYAQAHGDQLADPPRLLTGQEVQDLFGLHGPEIGQALKKIETAWVLGAAETREDALKLLESSDD